MPDGDSCGCAAGTVLSERGRLWLEAGGGGGGEPDEDEGETLTVSLTLSLNLSLALTAYQVLNSLERIAAKLLKLVEGGPTATAPRKVYSPA